MGEPNRFALQTVAQVASEAGVQPSTLIRFAKVFGFSGYSELQQLFRERLIEGDSSFRDRTREYRHRVGKGSGRDVGDTLKAFAEASVLAIRRLKAQIDADTLREAVRILDAAESIYVIGRGEALPLAMCLAYGLIELQRRCLVLDAVAGTLAHQVACIGRGDLLIAASLGDESPSLVKAVADAHERGIPVLAITDSETNPLARNSRLCFTVRDAEIHRFSTLAPFVVLVQSLVVALERRQAGDNGAIPATQESTAD